MATKEDKAQYARMWRAKRKAAGLCIDCGKPVAEGRIRCEFHLARTRERMKAHYERDKQNRICPGCGKHMSYEDGVVFCLQCRDKMLAECRERRKRRKGNGDQ